MNFSKYDIVNWPYQTPSIDFSKEEWNTFIKSADKVVEEWSVSHNCWGRGWENACAVEKDGNLYELHDYAIWSIDQKKYIEGFNLRFLHRLSGQDGDNI